MCKWLLGMVEVGLVPLVQRNKTNCVPCRRMKVTYKWFCVTLLVLFLYFQCFEAVMVCWFIKLHLQIVPKHLLLHSLHFNTL